MRQPSSLQQPALNPEPRPIRRAPREGSQRVRLAVQLVFLALCGWIGVEFLLFMRWGTSGGQAAYAPHPPGAEGFLPIGSLLALKYWAVTGRIHGFHPAGLFIFLAALGLGLLLKKAFCSWLCPVGTVSEWLWLLGRRALGRNLALPRWLDLPLRALKYLLLAFFAWAVGKMDGPALAAFLNSPYSALADVKMYLFFARISGLSLGVILVLAALSLVVQNFWCRYLCPYGALLGLLSLASPLRITRTRATCTDCQKCTRACPARIQVHQAARVASDECTACYRCVAACPVKDTLQMRAPAGQAVPGWVFGALAVGLFVAVTGLAMLSGHWRSSITGDQYLQLIPLADRMAHPR